MSPEDAARRARLPQWAQRELERLERNVDSLKAKLAAGPEESDTFVDDYSASVRRPLGLRPRVTFHLGSPEEFAAGSVSVRVSDVGGRQLLRLEGVPSLTVHPWVTNALYVSTDPVTPH